MGGVKAALGKSALIRKRFGAFPNLFLPWNPFGETVEQSFLQLIHSMKKNIL
jgi:hypothetical protein